MVFRFFLFRLWNDLVSFLLVTFVMGLFFGWVSFCIYFCLVAFYTLRVFSVILSFRFFIFYTTLVCSFDITFCEIALYGFGGIVVIIGSWFLCGFSVHDIRCFFPYMVRGSSMFVYFVHVQGPIRGIRTNWSLVELLCNLVTI